MVTEIFKQNFQHREIQYAIPYKNITIRIMLKRKKQNTLK